MKKLIRIIIRIILEIFLIIGSVFLISKISMIDMQPVLQIILFLFITAIAIILSISIMSNPGVKMNLFKSRKRKIKKKEKTPEFVDVCKSLMMKNGKQLEKYRYDTLKYLKILFIFLVLAFILTIVFIKFIEVKVEVLILIYIIPTLILLYKYDKSRRYFNKQYKENIIKELVSILNSNLNYDYNGSEKLCNLYMDANFKEEEFNMFESTDYIYGRVKNNINIELSRISLLNCNKSNEIINVADTFVFSYSKLNFLMPFEIRIVKNKLVNKNKVEMDSEEFEKYFDVISNSHMTAMQILTHDVMEEITYFYRQYGVNFEILIKENSIYIKFETGDIFKPSLFKKVIDNDLLWIYYNILDFTISLSYKINKLLEGLEI